MIVCDTGPLVAAALSNDSYHVPCVKLFNDLHAAGRELLIPATVIAEVGYLLNRGAGPRAESLFLRSVAEGPFTAVDLIAADAGITDPDLTVTNNYDDGSQMLGSRGEPWQTIEDFDDPGEVQEIQLHNEHTSPDGGGFGPHYKSRNWPPLLPG